MRKVLAGLLVGAVAVGTAVPVRAHDQAAYTQPMHPLDQNQEAWAGVAAALANVGYFPAKLVVASAGMVVGSLVGFATGGDTRASYAVMTPMVGGDYLIRSANIMGETPLDFWGRDYADEPSQRDRENQGSKVYDSAYGVR